MSLNGNGGNRSRLDARIHTRRLLTNHALQSAIDNDGPTLTLAHIFNRSCVVASRTGWGEAVRVASLVPREVRRRAASASIPIAPKARDREQEKRAREGSASEPSQ